MTTLKNKLKNIFKTKEETKEDIYYIQTHRLKDFLDKCPVSILKTECLSYIPLYCNYHPTKKNYAVGCSYYYVPKRPLRFHINLYGLCSENNKYGLCLEGKVQSEFNVGVSKKFYMEKLTKLMEINTKKIEGTDEKTYIDILLPLK